MAGISAAIAATGRGIGANKIRRVLMPFPTTREAANGSGLGPSASYCVVRGLGKIQVEGLAGKGILCTVVLLIR